MKRKISITVEDALLDQVDNLVDNIYIRNRSQAIEHLIQKSVGKNRTAVIIAGGPEEKIRIGKEYRLTAKTGNTTVVERVLRKLRQHGFKDIIIVARQAVLTNVFRIVKDGAGLNVHVSYVEEKTGKGTADTLRLTKGKVNTAFLVVYGHILFDNVNIEELWQQHVNGSAVATLLLTTGATPSEKGTVTMEGNTVLAFTQKPKQADNYLVFSPIFVAEPEIVDYTGDSLEYDVFPQLAKERLLQGHVSSQKEQHIHSKKDISSLTAQ